MALRWGIAGSGRICNDFVSALGVHPKENHQVVVVAARKLADAEEFAKKYNIPNALEGYEALAKQTNIDIVYIGTLNVTHLALGKLMLDHGKHILCEKPLTMNKNETKELLDYARSKNLFAMEAIWSRSFPVYHELRKIIDNGSLGDIKYLNIPFGFKLSKVLRVNAKEMGGSTILDIGVYVIQMAQMVFKGLKPIKLVGDGIVNSSGIDIAAACSITYADNKMACLSVNSMVELPNEAVIVGTNGTVKIPHFWCPTTIETPDGMKEFPLPESNGKYNFSNSVGLNYEAEECRQCIKKGLLESPLLTHQESIEIADLTEQWRKSFNAFY